MTAVAPLLSIRDLKVHIPTDDGVVKAVDGLSFHISSGETLGVVGESGSGKSVSSLSIMRLMAMPPAKFAGGEILFDGEDLIGKSEAEMRRLRGNDIAMIYQEPMTSLNPVHRIGDQIAETVRLHLGDAKQSAWSRAVEMLDLVGIPEPAKRARSYPHEMSGGMRQRAMIAMALSCNPRLLIADEPTTALDVTIQAQILDLMRELQREIGMATLFITHDLGVIAEMADRVLVMYAGRAVEEASVKDLFRKPRMPYTMGLLDSIPRLGSSATARTALHTIPGNVPNPLRLPPGCAFGPRCDYCRDICKKEPPALEYTEPGHLVRCVRWSELAAEKEVAQ